MAIAAAAVYGVHLLAYAAAWAHQDSHAENYGSFSVISAKGDLGFAIDLAVYVAQIRNSVGAGFSIFQHDPFTIEHADDSIPRGNLILLLAAWPFVLTGSAGLIPILAPLLSIGCGTWLIARIVRRDGAVATRTACYAVGPLAAAAVFLLSPELVINFWKLFIAGDPYLPRNLGYMGRFPHVAFTLIVLIVWYDALTRYFTTRRTRDAVLLGVTLAVLQYSYFYYWTAGLAMTGLVLVLQIRSLRSFVVETAVVYGTYALLTVPFWIKFVAFQVTPFAKEYAVRVGQTEAGPWWSWIMVGMSLGLLAFDAACIDRTVHQSMKSWFAATCRASSLQLALTMATLICLNLQLIVGYTVQYYHWLLAFYVPLLNLTAVHYVALAVRQLQRWPSAARAAHGLVGCAAVVLVLVAGAENYVFGQRWSPHFLLTKSEQAAVDFLEKQKPTQQVMASNSASFCMLASANTGIRLLAPNCCLTCCSDEEMIERTVLAFDTMGYSLEEIEQEFRRDAKSREWQRNTIEKGVPAVPPGASSTLPPNYTWLYLMTHRTYYNAEADEHQYTPELQQRVQAAHARLDELRNRYRLDYLVVHHRILPRPVVPSIPATKVFENSDFSIWQVQPTSNHNQG